MTTPPDLEQSIKDFQAKIQATPVDLDSLGQYGTDFLQATATIINSWSDRHKARYKRSGCGVYLRTELILEEVSELLEALSSRNRVEVLDALVDLVYVTVGFCTATGLPFNQAFEEVHRSNMTKNGGAKDHQGDKGKGDDYSPPDLESLL